LYRINIEGLEIPYEVIINKRLKYIRFSVSAEGLKVSVPNEKSMGEVERILKSKSGWIYKHYMRFQSAKEASNGRWERCQKILYKGEEYEVRIIPTDSMRARADFDGNNFLVYVSSELNCEDREKIIESVFIKLYRELAAKAIEERLQWYSKVIGVTYNDVRIKEQKTRWGSCSKKGNLNFNWKIVMAPLWAMDYVIVHELCHLRYFDHSRQFWSLVSQYMPDYKNARLWLKENGIKLGF